jgi:hypothetical protein
MNALTYDELIKTVPAKLAATPSAAWQIADKELREKFTTRFEGAYSVDYDTKRDVYVLRYDAGVQKRMTVKITNEVAEFMLKHAGNPRWPSVVYLKMVDGVVNDVVAVML